MISLTFSTLPPSVNGSNATVMVKSKDPRRMGAIVPRRVKTKDFKAWLKTAGQEAMIQRQKPISGKVIVSIEARRESDRADADNIIKHLQDLLVKQGLISDDCKVKTVSATWVENDPSAPSCKVTVVEAA